MSGIFSLASKHADWLESRRLAIASNIANANTPGYKARGVPEFSATLEGVPLELARTSGSHVAQTAFAQTLTEFESAERENTDVFHSGNNVNVDQQFIAFGDVARSHALNTAIVRSFHRMMLASAKVQL